jgi:putative transposase
MEKLKTTNHCKHLIQYHLIFVCKYRYKVLTNPKVNDFLKQTMLNISNKYGFEILTQEVDKDHIHLLIRAIPNLSPTQIVRVLKQESIWVMWDNCKTWLSRFYWGNTRLLWTRGYFCSSIGNVSEKMLKEYIETQG